VSAVDLAGRLLAGDTRALARAISLVENRSAEAPAILRQAFPATGGAFVIGVTGFPGAGKSSLVDRLTAQFRAQGKRVGVIAVDPSSAFSGGAILGDRIRMMRHSTDPGVFIRSMATRGALGGLSRATADTIDLLDAAGHEIVLVETVGVGQDEIDVVRAADSVVVVLVPGMGDDIQAIKAGILEIADVFVINKSDQPGADRLQAELETMMSLGEAAERREIVRTVAVREEGIGELVAAVERHRAQAESTGERARRRERQSLARFVDLLRQRLLDAAFERALPAGAMETIAAEIAARRLDPYAAVERVLGTLGLASPAPKGASVSPGTGA
jgi:LAO/AO transport system kinase